VCRIHRAAVATLLILVSGCSVRSGVRAIERSEVVAVPTTGSVPIVATDGLSARAIVEALASDELTGRDSQTAGSIAAQELLVEQIAQFAQPLPPDGYLQEFAYGANILALIPGRDLADEYVIIGAHYDHVGSNCDSNDPADHICNGATDNASGVAVAVSVARAIAAAGTARRSVVLALWDAEEDGLLGSAAYVANPAVPLAQTVVYLNFDIQGATLLPSLADVTIVIGAETGGESLTQATARALSHSTLQSLQLSRFLFQGRSDHANFAQAGVPAVMLSDSVGGCYHTAQDEADIVDFAKLEQQVAVGIALVGDLAATDTSLLPDPAVPEIVFADAVQLLMFAEQSEPDLALLSPQAAASVMEFASDLREVVNAGASAFDGAARAVVLNGVDGFVDALTQSECQSFAA
jgi:hypothetical protein